MLKKVRIKNFNSIKNSDDIVFSDSVYILAGQNESGKSSVLEAIQVYENDEFDEDTLNFEEDSAGNHIQEVSCEYIVKDDFVDSLIEELNDKFKKDDDEIFSNIKQLDKINTYKITKKYDHDDDDLSVDVNDEILNILKSSLADIEVEEAQENGDVIKKKKKIVDIDENREDIAKIFFQISPKIILFNEFSDLLPDKILIEDLENKNTSAKGYNAVKNLEKILKKDFVEMSELTPTQKRSVVDKEKEDLSKKFAKAWKQRIHDEGKLEIVFWILPEDVDGQVKEYVYFSLETKNNVVLEPRKRSKGMIWFLSTWLELKAKENNSELILMFDEPGLHLHIKAHADILELFNELVKKSHQVIYTTHSPSLINTDGLEKIGLVINSETKGTIVEGLTTSEINTQYKRDALQPVAEAMGIEPIKDFFIFKKKNIILEGISDFYYFSAMKKILAIEDDFGFIPGIGIKGTHAHPLISFCIGYGLDWLLIMDNGINPVNTREDLKERIFDNSDELTDKKILLISEKEVENLFTISDLKLIDPKIKNATGKKPIDFIRNRKYVFSKLFYEYVRDGKIIKDNLSKKSIKNFKGIFKWINDNFISEA